MPIDPRIALGVNPPQTPNLMQQAGQLLGMKNAMQQNQAGNLRLQQEQMKLQQMRTDMEMMNKVQEIYSAEPDMNKAKMKVLREVGPAGLRYLQPIAETESALQKLTDEQRKAAIERMEMFKGAITEVAAYPPEQRTQALQNKIKFMIDNQVITPEEAQKIPQVWDDPLMLGKFNQLDVKLNELKKREQEAKTGKAELDMTAQERTMPNAETGLTPVQEVQARPNTPTELAMIASDPSKTPEEREVANKALKILEKHAAASRPTSNINLSSEGLDLAARQFASTGQMPSLGMGASGLRSQIINRAAEMYPKLDVASNKAEYDANKSSLTQMQKSYDAIVSFERTAQKNLDILLESAKNITDTGSPLLNKPLRALQEKVFGNKDIPAFRAARRIDVNEIAKIVSNPNMTGILTNEAREEINSLVPDNVTIAQLISVAKLMRRDMGNRKTSLEEQMAAIKQRIGGINRTEQEKPASDPLGIF